jgi:hypothetical protein
MPGLGSTLPKENRRLLKRWLSLKGNRNPKKVAFFSRREKTDTYLLRVNNITLDVQPALSYAFLVQRLSRRSEFWNRIKNENKILVV